MENQNTQPPVVRGGNPQGEKIIFDIIIQGKLAHIIVVKEGASYHINVDGEDLGSFFTQETGKIERFKQPKGAISDPDEYFKVIEEKLKAMGK